MQREPAGSDLCKRQFRRISKAGMPLGWGRERISPALSAKLQESYLTTETYAPPLKSKSGPVWIFCGKGRPLAAFCV